MFALNDCFDVTSTNMTVVTNRCMLSSSLVCLQQN